MQQTAVKTVPDNRGNTQAHTMIIVAITLFALSGLVLGLTVGAFTRPPHTNTPIANRTTNTPVTIHPTATPVPTATAIPPQALGCPDMTLNAVTLAPDGATPYTLMAQVKDRTGNVACSTTMNKPLAVSGVFCKLWMVKRIPDGQSITFLPQEKDVLAHADQISTSLTGTVQGDATGAYPELPGLQFSATTPQTQQCNAQGQGNWQYTMSNQVPDGNYSLIVLTDWSGFYSWSWRSITVKKAA